MSKQFKIKKFIIAVLAVLLIIGILTAFVACDDPNDNSGNNGGNNDTFIDDGENGGNNTDIGNQGGTEDNGGDNQGTDDVSSTVESELNNGQIGPAILEALYGYTLKSFSQNNGLGESVFACFINNPAFYTDTSFGDGYKGYSYTSCRSGEAYKLIYLFFYDSEANAQKAKETEFSSLLEDYDYCQLIGKTVLIGTSAELWEEIKVCKMPDGKTYYGYEKISDALKKPYSCINMEDIFDRDEETSDEIEYLTLDIYPTVGNCYESYSLSPATDLSQEDVDDFIEKIGNIYTNSSYIVREGDVYKSYAKMNPGMYFKLSVDNESYILTDYFSATNVTALTIPSEYNGKPVTKIDAYLRFCFGLKSVNIPKSVNEIRLSTLLDSEITDIYYDGTKADWENVLLYRNPSENDKAITVHCNDGQILLQF